LKQFLQLFLQGSGERSKVFNLSLRDARPDRGHQESGRFHPHVGLDQRLFHPLKRLRVYRPFAGQGLFEGLKKPEPGFLNAAPHQTVE